MKDTNPMFRMPGALLWIFCAPLALLIGGIWESNKSYAKKEAKRRKKDAAFRREYPEWWFYSD